MSDIRPFLSTASVATRPFAAALPIHPTPEVTSPWSPQPTAIAAAADEARLLADDLDARRARAADEGREAGKQETAAMRRQLATLVGELEANRNSQATKLADLIADAAVAVVGAWLERGVADRRELFAPIVRGWLQRTGDGGGATAQVHPTDVPAMRAAVGDALIGVDADATVKPGDVLLRGADLEITHHWQDRLGELRDAIAAAAEAGELVIPETPPVVDELVASPSDGSEVTP